MSQSFERAKSRLDNIKAIEPLLSALRTMSMGAWQMANNKIANMEKFETNYDSILFEILPHIHQGKVQKYKNINLSPSTADTIVLIVGSERGLCGKFNDSLIDNSLKWVKESNETSYQIWAMGSRLIRKLDQREINFTWRKPLPASDLTSFQEAFITTQKWIEQFESYDFNQFFVLYNQLETGGRYQFSTFQLLPVEVEDLHTKQSQATTKWPPPIIETDPKGIYRQIVQNDIASNYYQILLKSAAAEHAARFNLMQDAKDNAEEIIEELRQIINSERKRKITQQMQELAAGAGLLDNK